MNKRFLGCALVLGAVAAGVGAQVSVCVFHGTVTDAPDPALVGASVEVGVAAGNPGLAGWGMGNYSVDNVPAIVSVAGVPGPVIFGDFDLTNWFGGFIPDPPFSGQPLEITEHEFVSRHPSCHADYISGGPNTGGGHAGPGAAAPFAPAIEFDVTSVSWH